MSSFQKIFNALAETIADAKDMEVTELTSNLTLHELALDSLDYVELMVLVKRNFKVNINFEEIIKNQNITIENLCQLIENEMLAMESK